MFPFALIDDAVQDIRDASNSIIAANSSAPFTGVKLPVDTMAPDRVLTRTVLNQDNSFSISTDLTTLSDLQQTADDEAILECWSDQDLAQKLVVGATGNRVRAVTVTLYRASSSNVTGNVTLHIYTDNEGLPSALVGSSTPKAYNTITAQTKMAVEFAFASEVTLDPNTNYWLVLTNANGSSYKMNWYCKISGADAGKPAAVKSGTWALATPTKNMVYSVKGYYVDGVVELPLTVPAGTTLTQVSLTVTSDEHSTIVIDIVNQDTSENIYTGLANGQAISIDPAQTPRIKIKVNMSRDPSYGATNPILNAVSFKGTVYPSRYQWVDRSFKDNQYSKHTISGPGLTRTSGGLHLASKNTDVMKRHTSEVGAITDTASPYAYYSNYVCQLLYTPTPLKITAIKMRLNSNHASSAQVAGAILAVTTPPPETPGFGSSLGLTAYTVIPNTGWEWYTFTFSDPVSVPAGFFWAGVRVSSNYYIYPQKYNRSLEGYGAKGYSGGYFPNMSLAIELYGCEDEPAGTVTTLLELPGVKDHGLIYPLAYKPTGSQVSMNVIDPITLKTVLQLADGEVGALSLFNASLLNRLKLETIISQTYGQSGPVIALCYNYTGSEMSPDVGPRPRMANGSYTVGVLAAVGNYFTVYGRGRITGMSISGATASSSYGDGHKLVIDGMTPISYRFYNVTSKTWAYLQDNLTFSTIAPATSPNIPFNYSVTWDLEYYYGSNNGGVITVAMEVDE